MMATKIGLISDVHATPEPLREALTLFRDQGVDFSICAGDMAGYGKQLLETLQLLIEHQCRMILGNHDQWFIRTGKGPELGDLEAAYCELPLSLDLHLEDQHVYVVHANPPDSQHGGIKLFDQLGDIVEEEKQRWQRELQAYGYDVLIVGHTHQIIHQQMGQTLLVNPGSTVFNHSCAILTLPEQRLEIFPLSNKVPNKIWNWKEFLEKR